MMGANMTTMRMRQNTESPLNSSAKGLDEEEAGRTALKNQVTRFPMMLPVYIRKIQITNR